MSETIRFTILAGSLFAMSYFGVTWVMAGTPVPDVSRHIQQPMQLIASLPAAIFNKTLPKSPPTSPEAGMPPQAIPQVALPPGDGNLNRDELRRAALEASTAYTLTPCDQTARAVMIQAVSAYAKAWADMMGCGPDGCDYKKINATAAVFSTPLDIQVRDAIGVAFDTRGVAVDDFPTSLRINVAMLVRGRGAPATACSQSRVQSVR
jgi:hypothetical protein